MMSFNQSTKVLCRIAALQGWRGRLVPMLLASMLVSCVAVAAVVSMQQPPDEGELRIPVMLYGEGEETVSGLQFDLNYDATRFELVEVTAGGAATGAGKEVVLSETIPGEGRILITGFNDNEMADGHVATVVLRPLSGDSAPYGLVLEQVMASDPDGNSVPIGYEDLFEFPPTAPEKTDETPEAAQASEETSDPNRNDELESSAEAPQTDTLDHGAEIEASDTEAISSNADMGTTGRLPDAPTDRASKSQSISQATDPNAPASQRYQGSSAVRTSGGNRATQYGSGAANGVNAQGPQHPAQRPAALSGGPDASGPLPRSGHGNTETDGQFDALRDQRRLAFAAPVENAFTRQARNPVLDGRTTSPGEQSGLIPYPRLAAAALGPMLFGAMLAVRCLLFGRRVRPSWRRPQ